MRKLNKEALYIIAAVQGYKNLKISEYSIGMCDNDWFTPTEKYFNSIPKNVMESAGINKNRFDLEALLLFKITDEINNCEFEELSKFDMF